MANKYEEVTMMSDEGVTYSPSEISDGWVFTGDNENTVRYLAKINRQRGVKSWNISLGITDYFSKWVKVSYSELVDLLVCGYDSRRFRNCVITLTFHVKHNAMTYSNGTTRHRISLWPTVKRNENLNASNNWGEEE